MTPVAHMEPAIIGLKWRMFGRQFGAHVRVPVWVARLYIKILKLG